MRIAVCDDDALCLDMAADAIRRWSESTGKSVELLLFTDGSALLECYAAQQPDLILLDIVMPLFTGMEAAKEIRRQDERVKLVFLTSSPDFAVDSYDVKAAGYLLKPLSYPKLAALLDDFCAAEASGSLVVRAQDGLRRVWYTEIECIEARNKHSAIALKGGKRLEITDSFARLEEQLTVNPRFMKCHRSYLVNLDCVEAIQPGQLQTSSGLWVPIARSFSKALREAYLSSPA